MNHIDRIRQSPVSMLLLALLLALMNLLTGCGMTNDEIIAETRKCEEAGMSARTFSYAFDPTIVKVVCSPKKDYQ